jgi:3-phenylpropionate/cinnamic acid dioxygenase small subunit
LRAADPAILEEDKRTGLAWAEDSPSRTRHLIGNPEVAPLQNG